MIMRPLRVLSLYNYTTTVQAGQGGSGIIKKKLFHFPLAGLKSCSATQFHAPLAVCLKPRWINLCCCLNCWRGFFRASRTLFEDNYRNWVFNYKFWKVNALKKLKWLGAIKENSKGFTCTGASHIGMLQAYWYMPNFFFPSCRFIFSDNRLPCT